MGNHHPILIQIFLRLSLRLQFFLLPLALFALANFRLFKSFLFLTLIHFDHIFQFYHLQAWEIYVFTQVVD